MKSQPYKMLQNYRLISFNMLARTIKIYQFRYIYIDYE